MKCRDQKSGYSLLELLVAISLMAILLALSVANGRTTKQNLTSKMAAEELLVRLRRARQTAISKRIPVAIAIPRNATKNYSDWAIQVEGELNPRITDSWKIQQENFRTAIFVGRWTGPTWGAIPNLPSSFSLTGWWDSAHTPPESQAALFAFTPAGLATSNVVGCDGGYRILVAQGIDANLDRLNRAASAWTISLFPSGDCSLSRGAWAANPWSENPTIETAPGVSFSPAGTPTNQAPVVLGTTCSPDLANPSGTGKILDRSNSLALEVRVRDDDGDPPYFRWSTLQALDPLGNPLASTGRFAHDQETRTEWDPATKEWVGRTNWSPDINDVGGSSYVLQCTVSDRRGGVTTSRLPAVGSLTSSNSLWVLFEAVDKVTGRNEVWKCTVEGTQHQRLAVVPRGTGPSPIPIRNKQWTREGVLFQADSNGGEVSRVKADGKERRQETIPPLGIPGPLFGAALSPGGESMLLGYAGPTPYALVDWDANGLPRQVSIPSAGLPVCLSSSQVAGATVYLALGAFVTTPTPGVSYRVVERNSAGVVNSVEVPQATFYDSRFPQRSPYIAEMSISPDGEEAVWANGSMIYVEPIAYTVGTPASLHLDTANAGKRHLAINTGLTECRLPRFFDDAVTKRKGVVFSSGLTGATQLHCIRDLASPVVTNIPLPASLPVQAPSAPSAQMR